MAQHIVCLTFDFDVMSGFMARGFTTPTPISRGEFGVVGAERLLEFLENPRSLFAIASRHAKETSRLFLLAPRDCPIIQFYVLKHRLNSVSVRIINRREMEDLARSEGWFPMRVKPAGPIATASLFSRTA